LNTGLLQGFYLGDLLVDPRKGQVIGRAGSAHLPPKAMEVLLCLAAEPGELLTREDLLEAVWGKGQGSQEALSHAVSEIRQALDDHHDQPVYVQTLPKRGYRLLVDVEPAAGQSTTVVMGSRTGTFMSESGLFENLKQRGVLETALAYLVVGWLLIQIADIVFDQLLLPAWAGTFVTVLVIAGFPIAILLSWFLEFRDGRAIPHELSPRDSLKRRFSRTYISVIGALGIAGVFVFIYDKSVGLPEADIATTADVAGAIDLPPVLENSIAVLPFFNIDGTEETNIFANGLADDVITRLSRVPGLLVSSRGDAFTLAPNSPSSKVRERLRVALYLEGSIQIEGDTMRIIVQLIDSETGFHVLSRSIDRPIESFFEMRDEITEFAVANVRVALPPEIQRMPIPEQAASNLNAYMAYRHGKDLFEEPHTLELLENVIVHYEQALALDDQYAAAHAGRCTTLVARYELSTSDEDIAQAEVACALALESSPRLHMVHTALGELYRRTNRYGEAKNAYSQALLINPKDARAMAGLARVFQREQRNDEAERLHHEAIEIQPGNWRSINNLGRFYFSTGRYKEAANAYRQVVLFEPDNFQVRTNLGSALMMAGDFEAGSRVFEESLEIQESDSAYSNLGVTYYYSGEFENSVTANRKAVELLPQQPINWMNLADALYQAGHSAEAEEAYEKGTDLAERRITVDQDDFDTICVLAWGKQMLGESQVARDYIERGMSIAPSDPYGFYYSALIDVQAGQHDPALNALRLAVDNGYPVTLLAAEPFLAELRNSDEFQALVNTKN
jgi:TolB-like protein/tetratricopeptide (TPR) repeat protein/DNA-binding winged helix-turn-helix (wHTH) protein